VEEDEYTPVYIGLRPLYERGQYYTVTSLGGGRYEARIHNADGSIADTFEDIDEARVQFLRGRFAGAGLPEGGSRPDRAGGRSDD
jgi:hypothetical protein